MKNIDQEKINYILMLLKTLEYGNISITVHNGQITQIDSTEKKRFTLEKKTLKTP
ncbi:MAG TPA: YezD family protein [Chondromyces sp.]|nr:YezD family protein [Chondromyces sp.]